MARLAHHVRARPRLLLAVACGVAAGWLAPLPPALASRALLGWNVGVWLYLAMIAVMMLRADQERLRRVALLHAEGALTVLLLVGLAAVASLAGIVVELAAAKQPGQPHALPHVLLALFTVTGSWLLLPTMFTLTYASAYHAGYVGRRGRHQPGPEGAGLRFPEQGPDFQPSYSDFLYFAFTLAVASQTADVSVCSTAMRRLVLVQSLLSFAFNTAILALTVNIAASMF